jgi:hypothetical protein
MNFRDQGTCGTKDRPCKRGGFVLDGAGNAMGTKILADINRRAIRISSRRSTNGRLS